MNKRTRIAKLFLIIACFAMLFASSSASAQVIVKGSEVSVMFGKEVAQQHMIDYPGTSVDVSGGGKDNAIMMLAAGSCDIANSALSLAEQDRQDVLDALAKAEAAGHPIIEIPIAIDCVDFFVHKNNPVKEMTLAQLKGIYEGTVSDWSSLGGSGGIHAYRSGSDDHKLFTIHRWLTDDISPNADEQDKKLLFNHVAGNPSSIGYDGVYYVGDSLAKSGDLVHSLTIVGPDDAPAYAPSRRYPVSRNLFMFIRKGDTSAEAQAFIDYLLAPKAQRIVGSYVSPVMPPARTFEIALSANGMNDRVVSFSEGIADDVNLRFENFVEGDYTLYFRNNTLHDGTLPTIKNADGDARRLVNDGLFIVNRPTDPKTYNGIRNCNITEIKAFGIEENDEMRFEYNGQTVRVQFGGSARGGGSSGCGTGALGFGAIALAFVLARRNKRRQ